MPTVEPCTPRVDVDGTLDRARALEEEMRRLIDIREQIGREISESLISN